LLKLYRICRKDYAPKDPSGAIKIPGRWHVQGQKVLYFCSSLAMCVLELRANSVSFAAIRSGYHYIEIEIDTASIVIEEVPISFYVKNWISDRKLTQKYGTGWFKSKGSLFLKVNSAVLPTDFNFILNTTHPGFASLHFPKPKAVPLDPRIV
jgi:RES domain-containing protein